MKSILSLLLLLANFATYAANSPSATDMTFVTDFTHFSCRAFQGQAPAAPKEIEELGIKFTKLGIAKNTRRVIIDIESQDGACSYSADYSRKKGEKQLRFENSSMTDSESCSQLKEDLDEIMRPGFKYAIKFNAYISMLFLANLTTECEVLGGNALIEYQWKL